jgi:hypothetical protein
VQCMLPPATCRLVRVLITRLQLLRGKGGNSAGSHSKSIFRVSTMQPCHWHDPKWYLLVKVEFDLRPRGWGLGLSKVKPGYSRLHFAAQARSF